MKNADLMQEKPPKPRQFFEDLRQSLTQYREANGKTQEDVAKMINATRGQISAFETGTNLPREETLEKLIALLKGPTMLASNEFRNMSELLLADDIPIDDRLDQVIERLKFAEMALHRARRHFKEIEE